MPMVPKKAQSFTTYTYSQVEAALAEMHSISEQALGTFRARIKHFQRIGLVPVSPGKGAKISYTLSDILFWAACFELAEAGMTPTIVKGLTGVLSIPSMILSTPATQDVFLCIVGNFLKWQLSEETGKEHGAFKFAQMRLEKLPEWLAKNTGAPVIVLSISSIQQRLAKALNLDWSKINGSSQALLDYEFRRKENGLGR